MFQFSFERAESRFGPAVLFMIGFAGCLVLAAALRQGFRPTLEVWLSAALIVMLILYTHLRLTFGQARQELVMLRSLAERMAEDPEESARKVAPALRFDQKPNLSADDKAMLTRLRNAIESNRLDLYLQPIVGLPQRNTRFYEAFSRLRDADGNVLGPRQYLDAAERANRIGVVDNLILLRCVQALRELEAPSSQRTVFCNISPATLYDTAFFSQFASYLESNADLAPRIVFEFTWPAFQTMHPRVAENVEAIASKGFSFSVDHVHNLDLDWNALRDRHVRYVKAPARLLIAADRTETERSSRRDFLRRLADAGIALIAEKIEAERDMPEVLQLSIDYGQGNLFGPPRRAEAYLADMRDDQPLAKAS